ncbi:hypothetical protein [Rhizobium sp. CNPSo 3490]|uniref:hypothetical protein n=1 Tax=Rhizobium sp. CNPSo 3490 TaxID=3021407 RepID=UPI00254FE77C|nr:hypothetical protein [Rhizobium sp. CNPSo 3490]MDK4733957.1 hypothetical protein [Rhizobium sp. CNPSo 3490]
MRDLIESILPRTYLSELDEEFGVVDVEELVEALAFDADDRRLSATSAALQKTFAMMHLDGALGVFATYSEMLSEIEDLNDWQPEGRELRGCALRTFINRISALEGRAEDEAGCDLAVLDLAA